MSRRASAVSACALTLALAGNSPVALSEPRSGESKDAIVFHAGLNLRTDTGVHQARLDGGIGRGPWHLTLVVDPLVAVDGELDTDVLVGRDVHPGWALAGGWRASAIALDDGSRFHQHLLIGATAELPCLVRGIRAQLGVELAITAVRHGGGIDAAWVPVDGRVLDLVQPGMFVRIARAWER